MDRLIKDVPNKSRVKGKANRQGKQKAKCISSALPTLILEGVRSGWEGVVLWSVLS